MRSWLIAALCVAALSVPARAADNAPHAQAVSADTPEKTPSGVVMPRERPILRKREGGEGVLMDFGSWNSHAATRKNDDSTISLYTIDPAVDGFEFVIGTKAGKRVLTLRDGQHEYEYGEG